MLFQKIKPSEPLVPITKEQAQDVYWLIKQRGTESEAFSKSNKYPFEYFVQVMEEVKRLETLGDTFMRSENQPQSKTELMERLSSDLIDAETFTNDYIDYVLTYEENTSWEDFVSQFTKDEGITI